jgi:hypothetical protein
MQAWSEQPYVLSDRSRLWRVTGSNAVLGTLGALRVPADARLEGRHRGRAHRC